MKKDNLVKRILKLMIPSLVLRQKLRNILHASNNKVITSVGYNMRFTERLQYMKKQIIRGNLNDIQNVNIEVLTDFRKWRKNKDYISHTFDWTIKFDGSRRA